MSYKNKAVENDIDDNKTLLTIRVKKATRAFCTNVSPCTYEELKEIARRDKLSLAKVVDRALNDFIVKDREFEESRKLTTEEKLTKSMREHCDNFKPVSSEYY